jgi:DNA-binding transcriptional ArsR family regulator
MKRWSIIFKALSNVNRLKIIKLLSKSSSLSVGEIAEQIDISPKATSKHLIILHSLDVLESKGKEGHVLYSLNLRMPRDFYRILRDVG